ncbi:CheR family methyltransferase [Nitratiruptor sp. SB155-2]|uniref:CheR family methyltransferase n=1 Tax=Nitratiruptor sp. (strain SB155-2) TaxID=387092 RepID=UPI000158712B|nr:protein-glutamate O-methyltransferase CheR [Nitratiruptor sp. SB155-2]BAF70029.1 chemotaxis protein methyltransferase [Nitratiruptor sp. SB155-2]
MLRWLFPKKNENQKNENKESHEKKFDNNDAKIILREIREEYGLDFSNKKEITIEKMKNFAIQHDIYSFTDLREQLLHSHHLKKDLINKLTVGETYFYRETAQFEILVKLMRKKRVQRILCIPCSSGEEVYTIVLYILTHQKDLSGLEIVGVDINSDRIEQAKRGCYSSRSIQQVPSIVKEKYFYQKDALYCVDDILKQHVSFKQMNIFNREIFTLGKFDVIFCRNLLYYFDEEHKSEAIEIFDRLLSDTGVLFLGHADLISENKLFTKVVENDGKTYYIKSD